MAAKDPDSPEGVVANENSDVLVEKKLSMSKSVGAVASEHALVVAVLTTMGSAVGGTSKAASSSTMSANVGPVDIVIHVSSSGSVDVLPPPTFTPVVHGVVKKSGGMLTHLTTRVVVSSYGKHIVSAVVGELTISSGSLACSTSHLSLSSFVSSTVSRVHHSEKPPNKTTLGTPKLSSAGSRIAMAMTASGPMASVFSGGHSGNHSVAAPGPSGDKTGPTIAGSSVVRSFRSATRGTYSGSALPTM